MSGPERTPGRQGERDARRLRLAPDGLRIVVGRVQPAGGPIMDEPGDPIMSEPELIVRTQWILGSVLGLHLVGVAFIAWTVWRARQESRQFWREIGDPLRRIKPPGSE